MNAWPIGIEYVVHNNGFDLLLSSFSWGGSITRELPSSLQTFDEYLGAKQQKIAEKIDIVAPLCVFCSLIFLGRWNISKLFIRGELEVVLAVKVPIYREKECFPSQVGFSNFTIFCFLIITWDEVN